MISGDTWFVQFDNVIYGPYTTGQMNGYIVEGRVTANSWITTNPSHPFKSAHVFSNFAQVFNAPPHVLATTSQSSYIESSFEPSAPLNSEPLQNTHQNKSVSSKPNTFGLNIYELSNPIDPLAVTSDYHLPVQETVPHLRANPIPITESEILLDASVETTHQAENIQISEETVILIMAELKTSQTMGFLKALQLCGVAERIGHSVWLIRTPLSATALRNRLSHTVSDTDRLFIMDSYNGQTAWFNIGSDMDARIRKLWSE